VVPIECSNVLVIVAKRPEPGETKTRLSPPLNPEQASALYECFLLDTLDLARRVEGIQRTIAFLPVDAEAYFRRLAPDFQLMCQEGDSLGERLDRALSRCLSLGYRRAAVLDSDSPTLPPVYLRQAFQDLEDGAEVVIGPCEDGGYYLLGVTRRVPRLLREVRMSTAHTAADTIAIAAEEGLRLARLPAWYDVDEATALARLLDEIEERPMDTAFHTRRFVQANSLRALLNRTGND
jgi:uncharacterized protein